MLLAPIDIPASLEQLANESLVLSKKIIGDLKDKAQPQNVLRGRDLVEYAPHVILINSGFIKFYSEKKLVRYYGDDQIIVLGKKEFYSQVRLESEFASQISLISLDDLAKCFDSDSSLYDTWIQWQVLENQILHHLCALYTPDDVMPNMEVKQFAPGDNIITEGSEPDQIFIMIHGEAHVTSKKAPIGHIHPNEVFGEISFLADQKRTATVTAKTHCMVQALGKDDFFTLIPQRPALIMALATSMANRIVQLNEKVTKVAGD
jgi:hypothetical protein